MFRVIILTLALSHAYAQEYRYMNPASESQRRFAIQNRYDDTGPGAKGPEYAYNTYRTLEEALVSYIDDNDTKLPDHERAKFERFVSTDYSQPIREYPKTVEEYTGLKRPANQALRPIPPRRPPQAQPVPHQPINHFQYQPIHKFKPEKLFFQDPNTRFSFLDFRGSDLRQSLQSEKLDFKVPKIQPVRSSPLSLAHYTRSDVEQFDEHDPHPQYSFSYGVNDRKTGDSKSAHETRDGSSVKGYYTFMDPDGKQRTVHYVADDKLGFRATVQRTQMNV